MEIFAFEFRQIIAHFVKNSIKSVYQKRVSWVYLAVVCVGFVSSFELLYRQKCRISMCWCVRWVYACVRCDGVEAKPSGFSSVLRVYGTSNSSIWPCIGFREKRMLSHGRENFVRITYSLPTIFFSLACFPPGQKLIPKMECGELGQKSWFTGFLWAINLSENSENFFFCRFTVLKQSINHHVYLLFIHCSIASKTDFKRIAQWTSQLIVEFFISCSYFIATDLHVFAFMWKERKKITVIFRAKGAIETVRLCFNV